MKKLKAAFFTGTFMLTSLTGKASAADRWEYKDLRPPEEKTAEIQSEEKKPQNKKRIKKQKQEYAIRIELAKPEVQTKDTLITVPIEETRRKEIPFWFGIGLVGLGVLGIAGAVVSIAYKLKNRKFENGEPEFYIHSDCIDWKFYVEYPWKLKASVSGSLIPMAIAGIYLLSNSSETITKNVGQTAQVVVEPVPFTMQRDSSGAYFIVNSEAGWDSTLLYLSEIDTAGKNIKIVFSGGADGSKISDAKSIFSNSNVSIQ